MAHVATFITCVVDPPLALVNKRLLGRCSLKIWKIFKTFAIRGRSSFDKIPLYLSIDCTVLETSKATQRGFSVQAACGGWGLPSI